MLGSAAPPPPGWLQGCSLMTDNGLLQVAGMPALRSLRLEDCCCVTDAGVAALAAAALPRLRSLELLRCAGITAAGCAGVQEGNSAAEGARRLEVVWNR
jgi:hypothetical protein